MTLLLGAVMHLGRAAARLVPLKHRWRVMRACGWELQEIGIERGVKLLNPNASFGFGCYLNRGVLVEGRGSVAIGDHVAFGPEAAVLTSTHEVGPPEWRSGGGRATFRAVSIGSGCWIGARAMVLPGVSIGPGCVIAAGAVVVSDCDADGLYAGVPAVRKRELSGRSEPL